MINKNKEEIEKIKETIDLQIKFSRYWKDLQIEKEATIKTSILWCEGIIDILENERFRILEEVGMFKPTYTNIKDKINQLQTHLTWLKEQEKEI